MKILYEGPADSIIVGSFGPHAKGEVREYPDEVGKELIETGVKNTFSEASGEPDPETMTVDRLKADLIKFYDDTQLKGMKKKADLVALWTTTRNELKALAG